MESEMIQEELFVQRLSTKYHCENVLVPGILGPNATKAKAPTVANQIACH